MASHPVCRVALQVRASKADKPVRVVTYAVWVRGFTSMSPGPRPTATEGAALAGQPAAVWPLQVALSIIETVPSSKLAT